MEHALRLDAMQSRALRRAWGAYYTPPEVADYVVRATLRPWYAQQRDVSELRVLDPACGDGVFLLAAFEQLCESLKDRSLAAIERGDLWPAHHFVTRDADGCWQLTPLAKQHIAQTQLFGVDRDPAAVLIARTRLAEAALGASGNAAALQTLLLRISQHVIVGDALLEVDWPRRFPQGFTAIVGNPPYVNIREITKAYSPEEKARLTLRYRCARGSYDLYVLFAELAQQLLVADGRCGLLVPNKLATLGYAEPCREMLLREATLERIVDLSDEKLFAAAAVYPWIVIWQKTPPRMEQAEIEVAQSVAADVPMRRRSWASLASPCGWSCSQPLDVESRVATVPLKQIGKLHSGATGFAAARLAQMLVEQTQTGDDEAGFPFITTGNIDRYGIVTGNVRFMKRRFQSPWLPENATGLPKRKRTLYGQPKLVIAGLSKRLEVAYDHGREAGGGFALGVQVFAISQPTVDPWYLLAILNTQLLTQLFAQRYPAKRLAGNYLAINLRQLGELPIALGTSAEQTTLAELALALVNEPSDVRRQELDAEIDERVLALYGVKADECLAVS